MKKNMILMFLLLFYSQNVWSQGSFSGIGANIGSNLLIGDNPVAKSVIAPNFGIFGIYKISSHLSFKFQAGYGKFKVDNNNYTSTTSFLPLEVTGLITFFDQSAISPFLNFGVGAINFSQDGSPRYYDGLVIGGGGISVPVSNKLSFLINADLRYITSDQFDGINKGLKDSYFSFQTGITYNFNTLDPKFKREINPQKTNIIASKLDKQQADEVLAKIELRSKLYKLQNEITMKNDQINQFKSQVQDRLEKIDRMESEIDILKQNRPATFNQPEQNQASLEAEQGRVISKRTLSNEEIKMIYNDAHTMIKSRKFNDAINELTYLSNNSFGHPLESNSIYWIGECYLAKRLYSDAVKSFEKIKDFKTSGKFDDALLMCGICYMKMGNFSKAKENFQTLIQDYTDSEYLAKARGYLQSVEKSLIS